MCAKRDSHQTLFCFTQQTRASRKKCSCFLFSQLKKVSLEFSFSPHSHEMEERVRALEQLVLQLQGALVGAMEEVEVVRNGIVAEHEKTQSALRATVEEALLSAHRTAAGDVQVAMESHVRSVKDRVEEVRRELLDRFEPLEAIIHQQGKSLETLLQRTPSGGTEQLSKSQPSITGVQIDAVLKETQLLLRQADEGLQAVQQHCDKKIAEVNEAVKSIENTVHRQRQEIQDIKASGSAPSGPPSSTQRQQPSLDISSRVADTVQGMEGRLTTVSQQTASTQQQLAEMQRRLEKVEVSDSKQRERVEYTLQQLQERQRLTEDLLRTQRQEPSPAVADFTKSESEPAQMQRRIDEKQRREEVVSQRQDVVRCLSQVERMVDEFERLSTQQLALTQSVQRVESNVATFQKNMATELTSECSRIEQLQKAFFSRQEHNLANELHQMRLKTETDFNAMTQQWSGQSSRDSDRWANDLQTIRLELRGEMATATSHQQAVVDSALKLMKSEVAHSFSELRESTLKAAEAIAATQRRAHETTIAELRGVITNTADELHRVKAYVQDTAKTIADEHEHAAKRLNDAVQNEVHRVDRLVDGLSLRLNAQVEDEVKRVVSSADNSTQRTIQQIAERCDASIAALKEDVASCRANIHASQASGTVVQSLESQLRVLRDDLSTVAKTAAALKLSYQQGSQEAGLHAKKVVQDARSEILRDVGIQLARFDQMLASIARENALRAVPLRATDTSQEYGRIAAATQRSALRPASPPPTMDHSAASVVAASTSSRLVSPSALESRIATASPLPRMVIPSLHSKPPSHDTSSRMMDPLAALLSVDSSGIVASPRPNVQQQNPTK